MRKFIVLALGMTLIAASCNRSSSSTNPQQNNQVTTPEASNQTPSPSDNTPTPAPTTPKQTIKTYEISMTATGFQPGNLTINAGDTVKFVNRDTAAHWPASNPHPTHTNYSGFDAKQAVAAGSSWSFTFTKTGSWGYHDHLAPSMGGTIIVK